MGWERFLCCTTVHLRDCSVGLEESSEGRRCGGSSAEMESSTGRPRRGRSRGSSAGSGEGCVVGEVIFGSLKSVLLDAGTCDDFFEGRPLFRPSEDFVLDLGGMVVFFSFTGLPRFFGCASLTGEFIRTGFNLVMEMVSFLSPS